MQQFHSDVALMRSETTVEWTSSCSRERYIEYYKNNDCDDVSIPWYFVWIDSDDREDPLPKYDSLLVRRCNKHYNLELCKKTEELSTPLSYNGVIYKGTGHLFSTHCCGLWYFNNTRCACGYVTYLDFDESDFDSICTFNLDSTIPIGYPTAKD